MQSVKYLMLCIAVLLFTTAGAQRPSAWKTASSGNYTYKYVPGDPLKTRFYTLKNGLTVILSENTREPRVAVHIAVRAGSNTDPVNHTGLAHYLEHILFKGTDKFGTLDWKKEKPYIDSITNAYEAYTKLTDPAARKKAYEEIDRLSGIASKYSIANEYDNLMAKLGSQGTNAHTWYEETVYQEDIPSNAMDPFLLVQAERFRKPVIRIFHTELEAVYEEKNRSIDNDGRKVHEVMLANLFPTHNYGQQTTIGTIEHLKNPSIKAIQAYYDKYYVPGNMAIIMAGDFKADDLIKKIDQHFAFMKPKPVEPYTPAPEKPITSSTEKDVFGPGAEYLTIGYRTPSVSSQDAIVLSLISDLLYNGAAGLFDIGLNKNQLVQSASAYLQQMKDYGTFVLTAFPRQDQTLSDLKPLLLQQIEKLKSGDFDYSLVQAIVANARLAELKSMDNNRYRLNKILTSYIQSGGQNWNTEVAFLDRLAGISKDEIVRVANTYFGDNYVLVNKRKGIDETMVKVEKPAITPVETNAGKASPFVERIGAMPLKAIKPVWIDYQKEISRAKAGPADVYYVRNADNDVFSLSYRFDMGAWSDPTLRNAVEYLQFLGTDKMTAEDISLAFYKLACSYRIAVGNEETTITLTGLQENFDKAVALLDEILRGVVPNEDALSALKGRWIKNRENAKLNKSTIATALDFYARYGAKNPFNNVLSNQQIQDLSSIHLVTQLNRLLSVEHSIIYYGPEALPAFLTAVQKAHPMPVVLTKPPAPTVYAYTAQKENQVLFAEYDMVQSEIFWRRNTRDFDPALALTSTVFNNYFGGNMGSIVFQTIRESKALAYSTFARYESPTQKEYPYQFRAYVGSQADKLGEAVEAMNELLTELPLSERSFLLAREGVKKDLETERIFPERIVFTYLDNLKKGYDTDYRRDWYEQADKLTLSDIRQFHQHELAHKPFTYYVVASEKRVNMDDLKKIGEVRKLSLEELFGY